MIFANSIGPNRSMYWYSYPEKYVENYIKENTNPKIVKEYEFEEKTLSQYLKESKYPNNKIVTFGEIRPLSTKKNIKLEDVIEPKLELNVKPLVIKQIKSKKDLSFETPGEDIYALAESSDIIYNFNFWLHYNPEIVKEYPFSWSIFGNRSGDYYKGEEEMIESLQKFWRGLIVKNVTIGD